MSTKIRKLTLVERINHFKGFALGDWKVEVSKRQAAGLPHDEAVVATLNDFSVPTTGVKVNPHARVIN